MKILFMSKRSKWGIVLILLSLILFISLLFPSITSELSLPLFDYIKSTLVLLIIGVALIIPEISYCLLPIESLWKRWEITNNSEDQKRRMLRALLDKLTLIKIDKKFRYAKYAGSTGGTYITTLNGCTCMDFLKRRVPCKHMYKLAIELGAFKPSDDLKISAQRIANSQDYFEDFY